MTITETVAQALNIGGIVILTLFVFTGAAIGFILLWGRMVGSAGALDPLEQVGTTGWQNTTTQPPMLLTPEEKLFCLLMCGKNGDPNQLINWVNNRIHKERNRVRITY